MPKITMKVKVNPVMAVIIILAFKQIPRTGCVTELNCPVYLYSESPPLDWILQKKPSEVAFYMSEHPDLALALSNPLKRETIGVHLSF